MQRGLIYVVGVLIILAGAYFFFNPSGFKETAVYSSDQVVEGDYAVASGEQTTLEGGAQLTVKGNLSVDGQLACRGGDLRITVEGKTDIQGSLLCESADDSSAGIMLVAQGGLTLADSAEVSADGNIQLVDDASQLLASEADINRVWESTAQDSGTGQRVGPLTDDASTALAPMGSGFSWSALGDFIAGIFAPKAHAQAALPVVIAGKMKVNTPPPGVKRLVIFAFPTATEVTLSNFTLSGPKGRDGAADKGASCNAKGKDGEDAFRFNASAPNLKVNNFTLNLGDGGSGGDAETTKDCDSARAEGGTGGSSGNFKMTGGSSFAIEGSFLINPGRSGAGGNATAHGKDGEAGKKGGDATAISGAGANNKKKLSVRGTVAGTEHVEVGDLIAGDGGWATANPGKGGDADACGKAGGAGGAGVARGGKGGDAKLTLGGSAKRADLAKDIGGKGGSADTTGGAGGAGGSCGPDKKGGSGGQGGSASASEGKGGSGTNGPNSDGTVIDETGGAGGNGGDGCTEGKGGKGGSGDPKGEDGKDGKNLCAPAEKKTDITTGSQPQPTKTIKVIEYNGKYLPVDQLIVESEVGCGADHWHAAQGVVTATDGTPVYDPGPPCGYGKTKDKPVQDYAVPSGSSGSGTMMRQVDPPTLIIQSQ